MCDGDEGASISSPGRDGLGGTHLGPRQTFTGCGKVGERFWGEIACDIPNLGVKEQQLEFLGAAGSGLSLPCMWVI